MKQLYFALCMALALSFTACRDSEFDNPVDNGGENGNTVGVPLTVFDDLAYFQNAIIAVDSEGEMLCRSYGEVLFTNDPDHLYIGVKDLTEAETLFRSWIAPDVALSTTIPTTSGLTCPLTDANGKPQGTIFFTPGTETKIIAEVTASSDTQLKHFNKITFLLNAAWPLKASVYRKYNEGDIITHTPVGDKKHIGSVSGPHGYDGGDTWTVDDFTPEDQTLHFVCIRPGGNGKCPLFIAVTKGKYYVDSYRTLWYWYHNSQYAPSLSLAKEISNIVKASWGFYAEVFDKAGGYKIDGAVWTKDKHYSFIVPFYDYIYLKYGSTYGSKGDECKWPYMLKIDWLDDNAIYTGLTPTAGSDGLENGGVSEYYPNLFDGLTNSKWCSTTGRRTDGVWFVEFHTNAPLIPNGYKMTTANDCAKYKGRNPKSWKLYGKCFPDDEWTLLSEVQDGKMADINCRTYTYPINKQENGYGYYMYYRLEISSVVDSNVMMLSEFSLTLQNTLNPNHAITTTAGTQRDDGQDSYNNLFNSDSRYYWYCPSKFKQNDLWFVEFETEKPDTPVGYNLYTSSLSSHDYPRHPKDWKLYGKLNQDDEWTLIDEQTGQDLPHSYYTAQNYIISNPAEYQYYRYEVSAVNGAKELILGGFEFVYDD